MHVLHLRMGSVNLVVVVESMRTIITHNSENDTNALHVPSLIAVGAALAAKFVLFLYCLPLRKNSSQVMVLWEDHRNDLFINGFGVLMSAGGSKLKWCKSKTPFLPVDLCSFRQSWTRWELSSYASPSFLIIPHSQVLGLLDCSRRDYRLGQDDIPTIRAPGWEVRPARVHPAAHIQGDDVLG